MMMMTSGTNIGTIFKMNYSILASISISISSHNSGFSEFRIVLLFLSSFSFRCRYRRLCRGCLLSCRWLPSDRSAAKCQSRRPMAASRSAISMRAWPGKERPNRSLARHSSSAARPLAPSGRSNNEREEKLSHSNLAAPRVGVKSKLEGEGKREAQPVALLAAGVLKSNS
jgi:hypothetical protein